MDSTLGCAVGYGELVGVELAKRALEAVITKPLAFQETHFKRVRMQRLLVLYGAEGSGRRTLVAAFASFLPINVVEMTTSTTTTSTYAERLYDAHEEAREKAPAILFVRSEEALSTLPRYDRVFIILATTRTPSELNAETRQLAYAGVAAPTGGVWLSPASWARNDEDAPKDRFLARLQLLRLMMRQRSSAECLDRAHMHTLCVASHQATARQLSMYLDRVYARPLDRLSLQQLGAATLEDVTPTWADFEACLYSVHGTPCIVDRAFPEATTVRPYEAFNEL